MAAWQYNLDFMPEAKVLEVFGEIPNDLDNWIAYDLGLFDGVLLPQDYSLHLSSLGEPSSLGWVPDSINYGDYDNGSHLTIYERDTAKTHVSVRLDVGNWDEKFALTVLDFAKACKCVLQTKTDSVIEPTFALLVEDVKKSSSFMFCRDPKGYFLSDEVKKLNDTIDKKFLNAEDDPNSL